MSDAQGREAVSAKVCTVEGCDRPYCCKGFCRLHWERNHKTGTTEARKPLSGSDNPSWKGDQASYASVHARMTRQPRPAACAKCGTTEGRFEWALKHDTPADCLLYSSEGYAYSTNPEHYENLCKPCHNKLDLGAGDTCRRGHPRTPENLYVQPSNGKTYCKLCHNGRRRERNRSSRDTPHPCRVRLRDH